MIKLYISSTESLYTIGYILAKSANSYR